MGPLEVSVGSRRSVASFDPGHGARLDLEAIGYSIEFTFKGRWGLTAFHARPRRAVFTSNGHVRSVSINAIDAGRRAWAWAVSLGRARAQRKGGPQ